MFKVLLFQSVTSLVFFSALATRYDPPAKTDEPVKVKTSGVAIFGADKPIEENTFAQLTVKVDKGDLVGWEVYPVPSKVVEVDGQCFISGPPGSSYTVAVSIINFEAKKWDRGRITLTMAGAAPKPPDVIPPRPAPLEEATLTSQVASALKKDPQEERDLLGNLIEVYSEGLYTHLATATTWGDLFEKMAGTAKEQSVGGKLMETQKVIQTYLVKHLPSKGAGSTVISKTDKKKVRTVFLAIINALTKAKGE